MRELDKDQKLAVDCDSNVVVAAGAGSGKTTVLAERFLRLISEGKAGVGNILTLTFTRKAAAEMNERIYQRLINSNNSAAVVQAAEFDKAKISTLDSFSAQIVRNGSERFGVPGDFTSDNDAAVTIAREAALDFILRNQNNSFLKEFIDLHGFETVYEEVFVSLALGHFNISDPVNFQELLTIQWNELDSAYMGNINQLSVLREKILSLSPDIGKAMKDNIDSLSKEWDETVFSDQTNIDIFLGKSELLKLKKGGRSNHPEKDLLNEYVERWRDLLAITISIANGLKGFDFLEGIFNLLSGFQDIFISRKKSAGILTFQDVSKMAVAILLEDPDLRDFYKNEFNYIMIDEFQDNNKLQKDLLFLLAEKREVSTKGVPGADDLEKDKLFFVGDEKQSIYRFRGADVSVFKGLSNELIRFGGSSLTLGTNYRSEPDLVQYFNKIFNVVMREAGEPFEAEFTPLQYRKSLPGVIPEISVFYKPESSGDEQFLSNTEAEAWFIAKYIKGKVESGTLMINKGGISVPAGYNDFAILMRSTSNQILYEKYFRKLNIPCSVQAVRALFMEAPVNDIYNFLQLLVYPVDRVSYAALLRSPFVNLSDHISTAILLEKGDAFSLTDLDNLSGIDVNDADRVKYHKAQTLFFRLSEKVDFIAISELLGILWYEGGYRNYLMSNIEYHGYLEYFDYLKVLAVRADKNGDTLALFLDFIRDNLGKYEKLPDLELLREESGGVQILTIHKSKGLEFPVVIVANSGNAGRPGGSSPYYISDNFGITLKYENSMGGKANYFYDMAKELEAGKDLAENKRILYVAMTRAQSHLIISGGHSRNNKNPETATGKKVLLNMVLKGLGWDGDAESLKSEKFKNYIHFIPDVTEREIQMVKGSGTANNTDMIRNVYDKSEVIKREARRDTWAVSELNRIYTESVSEETFREKQLNPIETDSFLKEEHFADFGTFCHSIIEEALKGSENKIEMPPFLSSYSGKQADVVVTDAESLSVNFLNSDFYRKMKNESLESEISFLLNIGGSEKPLFFNGQIDLLIEKENGIIIVDFKTDRLMAPNEYALQMFLYRKAAEEIYNKPAVSYLFYLREGCSVQVETVFLIDDILKLI